MVLQSALVTLVDPKDGAISTIQRTMPGLDNKLGFKICRKNKEKITLTLTRPLRKKLRISADSSLIRQRIDTFFI